MAIDEHFVLGALAPGLAFFFDAEAVATVDRLGGFTGASVAAEFSVTEAAAGRAVTVGFTGDGDAFSAEVFKAWRAGARLVAFVASLIEAAACRLSRDALVVLDIAAFYAVAVEAIIAVAVCAADFFNACSIDVHKAVFAEACFIGFGAVAVEGAEDAADKCGAAGDAAAIGAADFCAITEDAVVTVRVGFATRHDHAGAGLLVK